MRLVRHAVLAPLALLVACGGNPQTYGGGSNGPSGFDFFGLGKGGDQQAALPGNAPDPNRLKGLTPIQVRSVLGKPVFTRRDAPAEIWQYRGRACTLDLFLYDEGGSQTVAHYAVRSPQPINEGQCLGELVGRNQGVPTS